MDKEVAKRLLDFAESDRQRQAINALVKHGTQREACKELGIVPSTFNGLIKRVKSQAARKGYSPEHDLHFPVADGQSLKGASTLYGEDGSVRMQWVTSTADWDRQQEIMREVLDEMCSNIKPLKPSKIPKKLTHDSDLLSLYVLTDIHLGMLANHEDGGANWDLKIAEKTITEAFCYLIEHSPASDVGFFAQLGDGLHSDGLVPVTPASGHVLDQDGRWHKIVRTAIRVFRTCVTQLLEKHKRVVVLMAQGNHDPASSVWLQEMFSSLYESDPRVDVIVSPNPYYAYQHGQVLLGFHHGHKKKPDDLAEVFIAKYRELYGKTKKTYIHTGHYHSRYLKEKSSAIVEQHATIAARDAYASHGGWYSDRAMQCIVYHKTRMEYARKTFVPEDVASC